ncbi:hypothetical protein PISMIDRAFT_681374 [Pisolithus microcarpus 441]|uniref:Uncharacterized protein n=1 Tax=Pisolithus microcarpus 441 TaxID=765257 RepID=A0A0C9YXA3_9AGAM|nr:hypothetical protein PISMIDRAFT_681374 [Pisolithus microcarpus 441]
MQSHQTGENAKWVGISIAGCLDSITPLVRPQIQGLILCLDFREAHIYITHLPP